MSQKKTDQTENEQLPKSKAEIAATALAETMQALSPESRCYYQGFLQGLISAQEIKKAG